MPAKLEDSYLSCGIMELFELTADFNQENFNRTLLDTFGETVQYVNQMPKTVLVNLIEWQIKEVKTSFLNLQPLLEFVNSRTGNKNTLFYFNLHEYITNNLEDII